MPPLLAACSLNSQQQVASGSSRPQKRGQAPAARLTAWRRSRLRRIALAVGGGGGGGEQELDLIEGFVAKLFGRQALDERAPGGMSRLSEDALKELYAAPTDQWAEALPGDSAEVAMLRPLLAQTQLETAPLRLAFDTDVHGWSAAAFHECVDTFGAALIVAKTEGGALVGGYNPRGWASLGEDRDSQAAFLFTWRDGDTSKRPAKLPKAGGAAQAVIRDQPSQGIWFGPDGLAIPLTPGAEREAKCKLGPYYERLPGGGKSLFAEDEGSRGKTTLHSLRVYVAEGSGEEWELNGIVWSTKR